MPCLIVESSRGKRVERSVRERPKKVYEKESLKGSRTESLSERARKKKEKERHSAVSKEKNLYKVQEVEVVRKIAACDPHNLCLRGITSSSPKKNTRISCWFPVGRKPLPLHEKLHVNTQRWIPHRAVGDQQSEIVPSLLGRYKRSSC